MLYAVPFFRKTKIGHGKVVTDPKELQNGHENPSILVSILVFFYYCHSFCVSDYQNYQIGHDTSTGRWISSLRQAQGPCARGGARESHSTRSRCVAGPKSAAEARAGLAEEWRVPWRQDPERVAISPARRPRPCARPGAACWRCSPTRCRRTPRA